jgi:hypothetical protein
MAKKLTYNMACKVAGQLYGSILQRNSDPEGFGWCVENLAAGTLSVRDIVRELCKSEEFREKFLMNDSPNEIARKLRKKLLGELNPSAEDIKETAVLLLEYDWRDAIDHLIDSYEYEQKHGNDVVPR